MPMAHPLIELLQSSDFVDPKAMAALGPEDVWVGLREWLETVGAAADLDADALINAGHLLRHTNYPIERALLDWHSRAPARERDAIVAYVLAGLWVRASSVDADVLRAIDEWFLNAGSNTEAEYALSFALYASVGRKNSSVPGPLQSQVREHLLARADRFRREGRSDGLTSMLDNLRESI